MLTLCIPHNQFDNTPEGALNCIGRRTEKSHHFKIPNTVPKQLRLFFFYNILISEKLSNAENLKKKKVCSD